MKEEYIDVNRLKENLITEIYSHSKGDIRKRLFARGLSLAYDIVNRQPIVEPKHGHWDNKIIDARFDVPHTVARCSNCKGKVWVYEENYEVNYPYCPLCGCKMDEVTDE